MRLVGSFISALLVFSVFSASAEASSALPAFDTAMSGIIAQGYAGGSLAVIRNGSLVYARGYGFANTSNGRAATATTRFRQASISKAVTASLLRKVVATGALSLETQVFPLLGVIPADARASAITVRMLKDHTSGLGGDYFFESREAAAYYGVASPPSVRAMVRWTAHYWLAADPGTVYRYNNTNYALLSRVLEVATGRKWIDLVRDMGAAVGIGSWRLGASLQKPDDEARYYEASSWRYMQSVFDSRPGTAESPYGSYSVESLAGAVSLVSTVIDMARYDQGVATGTLAAAEDNPIPTRRGWYYTYIYNGSMPGHYTFLMRIWNYPNLTVIAGAFNHRDAGAIDGTINQRIMDAYDATAVWPALDLSGAY